MRTPWTHLAALLMTLAGCGEPPEEAATVDMRRAPASCSDELRNQDESDVDCGGSCAPCAVGRHCGAPAHCAEGVCRTAVCAPAGCGDGVQNQGETDLDCGGPNCSGCAVGKGCLLPRDCQSLTCTGYQCTVPACEDGVLDGDESDVDCGGAGDCARCAFGRHCAAGGDCLSGSCVGQACAPLASCSDGLRGGTETDVDCGGPSCQPCGPGHICQLPGDCKNGQCMGGHCALRRPLAVSFQSSTITWPITEGTYGIGAGDFNGDGKVDLVVGTRDINAVFVLLGRGDGTFLTPMGFGAPGGRPRRFTVADFNNDKKLDVGMLRFDGTSAASVLLGNGDGTLQAELLAPRASPYDARFGDFDGDGKLDLVTSGSLNTIETYRGRGDGTFDASVKTTVMWNGERVVVGRIDGDQRDDLVVLGASGWDVFLGTPGGLLRTAGLNNPTSGHAIIGDLDVDGISDLLISVLKQPDWIALRGKGNGTFLPGMPLPNAAGHVEERLIDMNLDGAADLFLVDTTAMHLLAGHADGTFDAAQSWSNLDWISNSVVADLDGDGKLDVVTTREGPNQVPLVVFLNTSR